MIEMLLILSSLIILVVTFISGRLLDARPEESFIRGEEVILRTRRHWIVLAERLIWSVVGLAVLLSVMFFRALGVTLFGVAEGASGQMDFFNYLILGAILALLIAWFVTRRRAQSKKKKQPWWQNLIFAAAVLLLAVMMAYRFDGGRIFDRDPLNAAGFDLLNAVLLSGAILVLAVMVYEYFDWKDDYLTLTTSRVQYVEVQQIPVVGMLLSLVLQRRVVINEFIQQMVLEDVQQVNLHVHTYVEYWLERLFEPIGFKPYGTITVQSLSPQRIVFRHGTMAQEMQKAINGRVNELKRDIAPDALLRRLIERDIYKKDVDIGLRAFQIDRVQQHAGLLSAIFPPNPEFLEDKNQTVVWRPSWIYVLWRELRPIALALLVTAGAIYASQLLLISGTIIVALWLPTILVIIFWMVWIYLEYRNDQYILSTEGIIDIDKRPFGPESRRQATLNTIQNVTFGNNFVQSIFHIGQVDIQTGGTGGKFTFTNVPSPYYVQDQINSYVLDLRRKQNEKSLRESISVVREYHNVQVAEAELLTANQKARLADNLAASGSAGLDGETAQQMLLAARAQARLSARRELVGLLRRIVRWQPGGGS